MFFCGPHSLNARLEMGGKIALRRRKTPKICQENRSQLGRFGTINNCFSSWLEYIWIINNLCNKWTMFDDFCMAFSLIKLVIYAENMKPAIPNGKMADFWSKWGGAHFGAFYGLNSPQITLFAVVQPGNIIPLSRVVRCCSLECASVSHLGFASVGKHLSHSRLKLADHTRKSWRYH